MKINLKNLKKIFPFFFQTLNFFKKKDFQNKEDLKIISLDE